MRKDRAELRKASCPNCGRFLFESRSAVLAMTCPKCGKLWKIEILRDGSVLYSVAQHIGKTEVAGI